MKYTEIKSFEDACKVHGIDPSILPDVTALQQGMGDYIVNSYKLAVIVAAINDGWVPDYSNYNQRKWYPWFWCENGYKPGSGSGFSFVVSVCYFTDSRVGARLVFESEEKCEYTAKTFLDLYEKVHMIF